MALKFLNKKGWHTGSLRNIENVWKAEQKHEAEQRKLEELRKQIAEERERAEFRQLQEQAGLVPKQERLDFLYESGLAVGKGSSEVFRALQAPPGPGEASTSSSATGAAAPSKAAVPGALFEEKPQSANDAWRKLHSDPLLLIRQKEQEALLRIKSNPVQMAVIRKSVEVEKKLKEQKKKEKHSKKEHKKKHGKSKHSRHSPQSSDEEMDRKKSAHMPSERHAEHRKRDRYSSEVHFGLRGRESEDGRKRDCPPNEEETARRNRDRSPSEQHVDHRKRDKHPSEVHNSLKDKSRDREDTRKHNHSLHEHRHSEYKGSRGRHIEHQSSSAHQDTDDKYQSSTASYGYGYNKRRTAPKLSQEEREARLREMQLNAEVHEEQRWKRLKNASEQEAQEAVKDKPTEGRNFLDAAQKSIYGTEKGGSSTIEESVRRRTFYLQGGSAAEKNAFRR